MRAKRKDGKRWRVKGVEKSGGKKEEIGRHKEGRGEEWIEEKKEKELGGRRE